ncbi:MFS general substrate transporter [Mycena floridula]|nr:MFS general substrate transporter [Mycena floridula]
MASQDDEKYSIHSGLANEAAARDIDAEVAQFFGDAHKPVVIDDETNKRLRWMIHKRVLVVMAVTYFAQTLDKGTINFASIMGIVQDTHLVGQQYTWLTTCVYIAILIWQFPANRLLQRLPIGKYLAFNIGAWGVVLACTAACKNFTGLVIVRTLLGIFECVCQPAFVYMSTIWYTKAEQPLIIGTFYAQNGVTQCVAGLIAYGIAHVHHAAIKNWQILFTLLGCLTVVWSVFVLFWLPDSPIRATCFTPEDRILMAERVRKNDTGIQNREFKTDQVKEAFSDLTVWFIVLISFTNALPSSGLVTFSNIIINAFGYTQLQTYLLAIAQGVVILVAMFSAAYLATRSNQRLLFAFLYTLPNVIGTIVFLIVPTTPHTKIGLLIAFYCTQGFGAVNVLNLAVMTGNIAGRTKQVIASTLVFIAWAIGNAIGPQVFQAKDKPRYVHAFIAHIILYGVQMLAIFLLRIRLMRLDFLKRRAQSSSDANLDHKLAFDDLTDWQNPDFRYVY